MLSSIPCCCCVPVPLFLQTRALHFQGCLDELGGAVLGGGGGLVPPLREVGACRAQQCELCLWSPPVGAGSIPRGALWGSSGRVSPDLLIGGSRSYRTDPSLRPLPPPCPQTLPALTNQPHISPLSLANYDHGCKVQPGPGPENCCLPVCSGKGVHRVQRGWLHLLTQQLAGLPLASLPGVQ